MAFPVKELAPVNDFPRHRLWQWGKHTTLLVMLVTVGAFASALYKRATSSAVPEPQVTHVQKGEAMAREPIHAPELEGGVAWLNTDHPITLAGDVGRDVVVGNFSAKVIALESEYEGYIDGFRRRTMPRGSSAM